MKMRYKTPAEVWQRALPLGDGKLGAMVYSGAFSDRVQINEDTLWTGCPRQTDIKLSKDWHAKINEFVEDGEPWKAHEKINNEVLKYEVDSYLPFGEIVINFENNTGTYTEYCRELDLKTAIHTCKFNALGGLKRTNAWAHDAYKAENEPTTIVKESFVSHADGVFVMRVTSTALKSLNLKVSVTPNLNGSFCADGNDTVVVNGRCPHRFVNELKGCTYYYDNEGVEYSARLKIVGDWVNASGLTVTTAGNNDVTIIFAIATSFNGYDKMPISGGVDCKKLAEQKMENACKYTYEQLKDRHIKAYQKEFGTMSFSLDFDEFETVDELKELAKEEKCPNSLVNMLFEYGRYLILCSSKKGSQPSNLQGIWSNELVPAWNCDYHLNINVNMNYWGAQQSGLENCLFPLFEMLKDFSIAGQKTAKDYFNANGWVACNNSDLWRFTAPAGADASWGYWWTGGIWLCRQIWEYYEYTLDLDFIREYLPILQGMAEFILSIMIEEDGYLTTPLSTSPENAYIINGKRANLSKSCAMDLTFVREALSYMTKICDLLGLDKSRYQTALSKLKPLSIGSDGRLLEWGKEHEETDKGHRHFSHLVGVYPCGIIDQTSEYYEPAKKSFITRIEIGSGTMGWSNIWIIALATRFGMSEIAYEYVKKQVNYQTMPNLMDKHPRYQYDAFQIDGNLGFVAVICEMLAKKTANEITLLPCIPEKWQSGGKVNGLRIKGGYIADFTWKDGKITNYEITDRKGKLISKSKTPTTFPLAIKIN